MHGQQNIKKRKKDVRICVITRNTLHVAPTTLTAKAFLLLILYLFLFCPFYHTVPSVHLFYITIPHFLYPRNSAT